MDTQEKNHSVEIEMGHVAKGASNPSHEHGLISAHTIDHDSWQQVGLMLVSSFNCGYILSFSNLMLVPLGWTWGIICLVVVGFFTAYSNWLLAGFHFIDGQRFIRYRDLMGFLYGRKMYYLTWVFQFLTLILGNMGCILLGGRALKEINSEFAANPLRLQYFIILTGLSYFIFSFIVPNMSAMKNWLGASTALAFVYIIILLVILTKDGTKNAARDYEVKGSETEKVLNAIGAVSAIIVCNTSGLLPEIQSTLRQPAIKNMRKSLYMQFSLGLAVYYGVSIVGYWTYGSTVSVYLPEELSGPKWAKILINAAVFLQSVIAQHMFIAPVHEALDTNFLKLDKSMTSKENIKRRLILRLFLFTVNTIITAAVPFMGDFVNLLGSFTLVPLTFIFPSMIFITVKGKTARREKKVWHWGVIIVFSFLAIATTTSAVRLIVNNIINYSFFADI